MTLVIGDKYYTAQDILDSNDLSLRSKRIIYDVKHIPTIGSRIYLGFNPAPTVTDVVYDYTSNYVLVQANF